MPEQLQKILSQITEWWKKFTTKQRILLGSITASILLALVILGVVVSRPTMVTLVECENTAEAGEVKALLDNDGSIEYEISQDGLTFYVDEKVIRQHRFCSERMVFRRRASALIMCLKVVSVLLRRIRQSAISAIWKSISQSSWRACRMSRKRP